MYLSILVFILGYAGLVLRLFSYWYEMDVVEAEALIQWREDTSQFYSGKGKALFQVLH